MISRKPKGRPMSEGRAWLIILAVVGAVLALCALTGCESFPVAGSSTDRLAPVGDPEIIRLPTEFRDIVRVCDGPNMIYASSSLPASTHIPASIFVLPNDPRCVK